MAIVTLSKLPIVISSDRVHEVEVGVAFILANDDCVVVWAWNTEHLYAVLNIC